MEETPVWPTYQVAPTDSIFALGVVSINYARFERAVIWISAAVSGLPEEYATMFVARLNGVDRTKLIGQMLDKRNWPEDATDLVRHFIKATDILV